MKKPYKFDELSDKVCNVDGCNKKIKKNLLSRNPNATKCFDHHMKLVRKNPRTGKRKVS